MSSSGTCGSQATPTTPLSAYLEQHNQLLRQQHSLQQQLLAQQQQHHLKQQPNHHRQKTYDQMIADITKVSDFSAKMSSFSNEAKVILLMLFNIVYRHPFLFLFHWKPLKFNCVSII